MDILNCYPKSKENFLDWMMTTYGVDAYHFNEAPFNAQCIAIARFLGYPVIFSPKLTNKQVEQKVHDYLYLYEDTLRIYPHGVPDYMKILEDMDYNIRDEMYKKEHEKNIIEHKKPDILPGLNAALVDKYDNKIAENKENSITDSEKYEDVPF